MGKTKDHCNVFSWNQLYEAHLRRLLRTGVQKIPRKGITEDNHPEDGGSGEGNVNSSKGYTLREFRFQLYVPNIFFKVMTMFHFKSLHTSNSLIYDCPKLL